MGRDVEVECQGFGIKWGAYSTIFDGDGHIHKDNCLRQFCELPRESTIVNNALEFNPIVGILDWIMVMKPDAYAIIDESFQKKYTGFEPV